MTKTTRQHLQILHQVETNKRWLFMVLFILAYVVRELWRFFPVREALINPFPFYPDQQISLQSYIWIGCLYAMQLIFVSVILSLTNHVFFKVAFWLAALEFVEYFLIYNEGVITVWDIDFNVTLVRFFILSLLIIREILHNKQ